MPQSFYRSNTRMRTFYIHDKAITKFSLWISWPTTKKRWLLSLSKLTASISIVYSRPALSTNEFFAGWICTFRDNVTSRKPRMPLIGRSAIWLVSTDFLCCGTSKVNGGNFGHVGNSGQRQFLQQIGRRRHLRRWRTLHAAVGKLSLRRGRRRRPIRCKNCRCPELPTCPKFPPFTLHRPDPLPRLAQRGGYARLGTALDQVSWPNPSISAVRTGSQPLEQHCLEFCVAVNATSSTASLFQKRCIRY